MLRARNYTFSLNDASLMSDFRSQILDVRVNPDGRGRILDIIHRTSFRLAEQAKNIEY